MREHPHDGGNLPLEIDKALSQQEIESGVQVGLAHLSSKEAREPEDHFHNTKHLLKQYRRVLYSVGISEEDLNLRVEMEHGTPFSVTEINAELAGIDLSSTKVASYTRSLVRSKNMIRIINHALDAIRGDPDEGERWYQILYLTYFIPKKLKNRDAILDELDRRGFPMSPVTYHTHLNKAINAMDRILWGYTTRDCLEIISHFLGQADASGDN